MKKNIKKKYSILSNLLKYGFVFVFIITMFAQIVLAADENGANTPDENGTNITTSINNPLGDKLTDIPSFIKAIVEIVLYVGIPIVALAIIYTGFLFVAAQGNSEKITKAKKALMYVLIGAALLLGAFVIANAIQSTVDEFKS